MVVWVGSVVVMVVMVLMVSKLFFVYPCVIVKYLRIPYSRAFLRLYLFFRARDRYEHIKRHFVLMLPRVPRVP